MIVEAVRDDGALMVTDGDAAAVVLPGGSISYLTKDSVYARGGWKPVTARRAVPGAVDPLRLAGVRARAENTVVLGAPEATAGSRSAHLAGHVLDNGICVTCAKRRD